MSSPTRTPPPSLRHTPRRAVLAAACAATLAAGVLAGPAAAAGPAHDTRPAARPDAARVTQRLPDVARYTYARTTVTVTVRGRLTDLQQLWVAEVVQRGYARLGNGWVQVDTRPGVTTVTVTVDGRLDPRAVARAGAALRARRPWYRIRSRASLRTSFAGHTPAGVIAPGEAGYVLDDLASELETTGLPGDGFTAGVDPRGALRFRYNGPALDQPTFDLLLLTIAGVTGVPAGTLRLS